MGQVHFQDAAVTRSAENAAIKVSDATIDLEEAWGEIFVDAPALAAVVRIDRKCVLLGRSVDQATDLDEAGLEDDLLPSVAAAEHLQPIDVPAVDRCKRREAVRGTPQFSSHTVMAARPGLRT
jgi:hypothetical protein